MKTCDALVKTCLQYFMQGKVIAELLKTAMLTTKHCLKDKNIKLY